MNGYFSHDSNARNDEKILALRMKHGMEGYGVYFAILERLMEIGDHSHKTDYDVIAFDLHVKPDVVKSVVEDFGLFKKTEDDCRFYSDRFSRQMAVVDEIYEKRRLAGIRSGEARREKSNIPGENKHLLNTCSTPVEQKSTLVEQIKGNKSKEDINISNEICRVAPDVGAASSDFQNFISEFNRIRGSKFQAIEKVKRQFNARLKEGFTTEQMLQALQNATKDKFHIENGFKYLTPEFFTRADKIEKFLNVNTPSSQEQEKTTAPKLGAGEWMRPDGTRTYGSGQTTVPLDAPPRQSASWWWNDGLKQWNL
jgi:hypothetical protein